MPGKSTTLMKTVWKFERSSGYEMVGLGNDDVSHPDYMVKSAITLIQYH